MLEAEIEDPVVKAAKTNGFKVRKVQWIGGRKAPDRLFLKPGRGFFVEFKAPGQSPQPGQAREIERMRAAGFEVHVVDDLEEGLRLVQA